MERPTGPVLWEALANSAVLAGVAFLMVMVVGIGLGVVTAIREGSALSLAVVGAPQQCRRGG